jgi:hypothetical protein
VVNLLIILSRVRRYSELKGLSLVLGFRAESFIFASLYLYLGVECPIKSTTSGGLNINEVIISPRGHGNNTF